MLWLGMIHYMVYDARQARWAKEAKRALAASRYFGAWSGCSYLCFQGHRTLWCTGTSLRGHLVIPEGILYIVDEESRARYIILLLDEQAQEAAAPRNSIIRGIGKFPEAGVFFPEARGVLFRGPGCFWLTAMESMSRNVWPKTPSQPAAPNPHTARRYRGTEQTRHAASTRASTKRERSLGRRRTGVRFYVPDDAHYRKRPLMCADAEPCIHQSIILCFLSPKAGPRDRRSSRHEREPRPERCGRLEMRSPAASEEVWAARAGRLDTACHCRSRPTGTEPNEAETRPMRQRQAK
ncbi:hypothetical protein METBIDRAFT_175656 [Metschnikowia bicuspidata var. bicuspidata NRRL YB-4993]|uniref:Uncharacterized protein n=1 Tax=Metschnikowia bicuspidata var. bicuspidata NRRL YB-4993 TaxID=869754 RepID=A0A1A0HAT1_9ASCO|nr:hypothetical protein METBIDRAFT_175656 [Metschnikowia bicuspidata var. bicuspidata NRRL YB-4993]OBA21121.1 hypothetical protein METBIDRAFT_175656 [Metschnikowia bicuspidata var. bicuspidata NRRL YB-4993]